MWGYAQVLKWRSGSNGRCGDSVMALGSNEKETCTCPGMGNPCGLLHLGSSAIAGDRIVGGKPPRLRALCDRRFLGAASAALGTEHSSRGTRALARVPFFFAGSAARETQRGPCTRRTRGDLAQARSVAGLEHAAVVFLVDPEAILEAVDQARMDLADPRL
ncbi:MAG: hypothetical protein ACJAQ3_001829 [Planctomycetota bacterium]